MNAPSFSPLPLANLTISALKVSFALSLGMFVFLLGGTTAEARVGSSLTELISDYGKSRERLPELEVLPGEEVHRFVSGDLEIVVHVFEGKSYWEKYRRREGAEKAKTIHRDEVAMILRWSAQGYGWTKPKREGKKIVWYRKDTVLTATIDEAQEQMELFVEATMKRRAAAQP